MKITFMRHGETDWNTSGRIQGTRPVPVNANGIREIQQTCSFFRAQPDAHFSRVITSPLLRARQSASICGEMLSLPIHVSPDFRERTFGVLEGKTHHDVCHQYGITDVEEIEAGLYGIEPVSKLDKRIANGLENLKVDFEGENILVMTHGSVIKRIAILYGLDNALRRSVIANGAYVVLEI